jgi:hypothetical protein
VRLDTDTRSEVSILGEIMHAHTRFTVRKWYTIIAVAVAVVIIIMRSIIKGSFTNIFI